MKELRLSAQELLYLCAMRGVKEVAGVEDVFLSVPEENLVGIAAQTRDSLVGKGCLKMDFDGNYSSVRETDELIDIITRSEKRIAFFGTDGGIKKFGMIYMMPDAVCLSECSDDLYTVQPITAEDVPAYFAPYFLSDQVKAGQNRVTAVSAKALANAKELFENNRIAEARKVLCEAGADDQTAALFFASYGGKARYFSMKIDSLVPDDVYSDGMIYISDGAAALDVHFDPFDEDDVLILESTDAKTEKERFESLLGKLQSVPVEAGDN